jgi:thiamine biosynthesis lipoprotein
LACNSSPSTHETAPHAARTTDQRKPGAEPEDARPPPVGPDGTVYAESEQMGTRVSVKIWLGAREAVEARAAIEAATAEIERIEDIMSEWREQSELSRFNRAAGTEVKLSPELFEVLRRAREVSAATDGSFDVTFHAVGQLWSFKEGSTVPDAAAIEKKLALVGWQKLVLDAEARTGRLEKPGMMIGLGAIAKGYAIDRAAALLRARGFADHIIEAGGDTFVSGSKGPKSWMVGVQNPDGPGTVGAIPVRDEAVVTSGDYQRFLKHDGKRYSHILDPKTGWPRERAASPKSVTLVAPNATDADAYATAVSVMGADEGMALVESKEALEAVIITRDGGITSSSGLADRLVLAAPDQSGARTPEPG